MISLLAVLMLVVSVSAPVFAAEATAPVQQQEQDSVIVPFAAPVTIATGKYYVNHSNVKVRTGPGTSYAINTTVSYGYFHVTTKTISNGSGLTWAYGYTSVNGQAKYGYIASKYLSWKA